MGSSAATPHLRAANAGMAPVLGDGTRVPSPRNGRILYCYPSQGWLSEVSRLNKQTKSTPTDFRNETKKKTKNQFQRQEISERADLNCMPVKQYDIHNCKIYLLVLYLIFFATFRPQQ